MADFKISGRMSVQNLQKQFNENFGATLRVYKGNAFADPKATLASIRTSDNTGGDLTVSGNMHVGTFEREMKENFGIKVQVASSDGLSLVPNDTTLAQCGRVVRRRESKIDETNKDGSATSKFEISALQAEYSGADEYSVHFNTDHWVLIEDGWEPEGAYLKFTITNQGDLLSWDVYSSELIPLLEIPETWHELKQICSGWIEVNGIEEDIADKKFNDREGFYNLCCEVLEYVKSID
jgi:hypothetical protein